MKKIKLAAFLILLIFVACSEYEHGPSSTDSTKPVGVTNVIVTPINGGLKLTYNLPSDKDILYVKAAYTNNKGIESEVKSSSFKNTIEILGYDDLNVKNVKLYAVDRSENKSDPISVTGSPLISPLRLVANTITMVPDFGGVRLTWDNLVKAPVSIELFAANKTTGKLELIRTEYTESKIGRANLRGLPAVAIAVAAVVKDRYGNISDTIYPNTPDKKVTPLAEERLDKKKFVKVILPNDSNWNQYGWSYEQLFDDNVNTVGHTIANSTFPVILTVDLGVNVALSRFNVLETQLDPSFAFSTAQPKKYALYGSKTIPNSTGDLKDWILLRDCESIKPSGSPTGSNTPDDIARFKAGDEFGFDSLTEVRYVRLVIYSPWGASWIHFSELTFWGQIIK